MKAEVIAVLGMAREVQVPLLAVLLLGGCAAKARRAVCTRSIAREMGPTALFPVRLRRPAAIVVCVSELGLGVGLLVTAGRFGAGTPALAVRWLTVILFGTAVGALHVLRTRRPAAGCGCFGELSDTPVNWRSLTGLRASSQWRQYHRYLTTKEPADIWREGCWRFAVFPAMLTGRQVEVV